MKILIVDSELLPARRMAGFFVNKGFICEHATDYNAASRKIDAYLYDIVILDTDINNGRGIQLITQITNKDAGTGIIVSTMRQSLPEKLECFELGADDYLVKPPVIEELYARVKALYRRRVFRGAKHIRFDDFAIDTQQKKLTYHNREIELTPKEYQLLAYFVANRNKVLNKLAIAEYIWGDHADQIDSFDAVYVHLTNLRKKLNRGKGHDYIKTIYGTGYKFVVN
ncbi:response regulator transcription factor [Mucilaginibacter sp. UR6-1]|uniref:response regulator transcription factor n=1 Tax=Mucilaginibacter sp. UR6-1 TaxID=1435643 RepID=UPI001E357BFF|nr:response regulator transcription factor [Mucilaginibacter sp. UR6-1]MCC8411195.1 response regulator transcription factor [Mucilaginibacter sp. UR6-1]